MKEDLWEGGTHRKTTMPVRVIRDAACLAAELSQRWVQCHSCQPSARTLLYGRKGLACGQNSNPVCIHQAGPDVLRRNLSPQRGGGFDTFGRAGG